MQVIQPLLGLSIVPLGIVKYFDISNRLLLKKESNYDLGFKNAIQPLGGRLGLGLQTKSPFIKPLINDSTLLLPRQNKPIIDEKVWNSENWDINEFTTFPTYELENEREKYHENETDIHTSDVENNLTTIITDLLPVTEPRNFDSIEDKHHNVSIVNLENHNITQDIPVQDQPQKKLKSKSKNSATTKSSTKNSNKAKKSQNVATTNIRLEANNIPEFSPHLDKLTPNLTQQTPIIQELPENSQVIDLQKTSFLDTAKNKNNIHYSHNEIALDFSVKQNLSEPENQYIAAQQEIHDPVKEILNQELISYSEETTIFREIIEESNNITNVGGLLENSQINNLAFQQDNSSVIESFINQETLASNETNSQIIPELLLQMTPDTLASNKIAENKNASENLNDLQKNIYQISLTHNSSIQAEYKQHNIEQNTLGNQPTLTTEAYYTDSDEIINPSDTSENFINQILLEENIKSEQSSPLIQTVSKNTITENQPTLTTPAYSADSDEIINTSDTYENFINQILVEENISSEQSSPLIQTASKNTITENQPIIIKDNNHINAQEGNLETTTKDVATVANFDSVTAKITQDILDTDSELNHSLESANSNAENTDTNSIVNNLINYQQIELDEIQQNNLYPEVSAGDNLDTLAIQKKSQQNNITLKANNLANNAIASKDLAGREHSLTLPAETSQKATPTELLASKLEDNSLETPTLENLPDTTEVSPQNNFVNLLNQLSDNLPAPTGYAIGGLVTPKNISDNSAAAIAPSDTVPAMLTPGEFVINASDAQKNIHVLRHINSGGTLSEDISTSNAPNIQSIQAKDTSYIQPSTQVDNFPNSPDIISPKIPNISVSSRQKSGISHPGMIARHSLQFNLFNGANESLTTEIPKHSHHYSSPPLIFRQANTNNTTTANNFNTSFPSEWGSVEELLNGNAEDFTAFDFNQVNHHQSNLDNSTNLQTPQISTKRLPTIQGFADGGEVAKSDIATDIEPVTETVQNTANSANNYDASKQENNQDNSADLETLASEIYSKLCQRLEIERERYGMYSGRLPW
ncbi:MAG: hypothetical protein ACYTXA_09835 [Nostoc sp.]